MTRRQRAVHLAAWIVLLPIAIAILALAVVNSPKDHTVRSATLEASP